MRVLGVPGLGVSSRAFGFLVGEFLNTIYAIVPQKEAGFFFSTPHRNIFRRNFSSQLLISTRSF